LDNLPYGVEHMPVGNDRNLAWRAECGGIDESSHCVMHVFVPAAAQYPCQILLTDYQCPVCVERANVEVHLAAHAYACVLDRRMFSAQRTVESSVVYRLAPSAQLNVKHQVAGSSHAQRSVSVQLIAQQEATIDYTLVICGGGDVTATVELTLSGKASQAMFRLVTVPRHADTITIDTKQCHTEAATTSTLQVRGLVKDAARVHCTGLVRLEATAIGADASQKSTFLLEGSTAQAYARPVLEALTHQVRCAHGSAVGQLDQEQLTYLQMRGLSANSARMVLVYAFLSDGLDDEMAGVVHQALGIDT